jgi:hypothetical protein
MESVTPSPSPLKAEINGMPKLIKNKKKRNSFKNEL